MEGRHMLRTGLEIRTNEEKISKAAVRNKHQMERVKREYASISDRFIRLYLSGADYEKFSKMVEKKGIGVSTLIEHFISDMVGGIYNKSIDDRTHVNQWYEHHSRIDLNKKNTFLKFLLESWELGSAIDEWTENRKNSLEFQKLWNNFLSWTDMAKSELSKITPEDEMEKVFRWNQSREELVKRGNHMSKTGIGNEEPEMVIGSKNNNLDGDSISERLISLKLSDADCKKIYKLAGRAGMDISTLLELFISDMVNGTYCKNIFDAMHAKQWFEFHEFDTEKTFLKFLLDSWKLEIAIIAYTGVDDCDSTIKELDQSVNDSNYKWNDVGRVYPLEKKSVHYASREEWVQGMAEEKQNFLFEKKRCEEELQRIWGEFLVCTDLKEPELSNMTLEGEMEKVCKWDWKRMEFMGIVEGEEPQVEEVKEIVQKSKKGHSRKTR